MSCEEYNPDNVFKTFKVVEFPISYVNLSTTQNLNIEADLNTSAYLKTTHDGQIWVRNTAKISHLCILPIYKKIIRLKYARDTKKNYFINYIWIIIYFLQKFNEARELSASHRAFNIVQLDNHTIQMTFQPKNECISKAKHSNIAKNTFLFDLRLIKVDGIRCCNNELHSEIGRYYITGQYEYIGINHHPKIVDFGDVCMSTLVIKYLCIQNESSLISAKISYVRMAGFEVTPSNFTIHPNTSKQLRVTIKPTCLKVGNRLVFHIKNPHNLNDGKSLVDINKNENNHLTYLIPCEVNVIYCNIQKEIHVKSLHKLQEQDSRYTYIGTEVELRKHRKGVALTHLQICKLSHVKKPILKILRTGNEKCCSIKSLKSEILPEDFCKTIKESVDIYSLRHIFFLPFSLNFGRVGLMSYGELSTTIKNDTNCDVTIELNEDACCLYSSDKLSSLKMELKSKTEFKLEIFCWGFVEGNYKGTFEYTIDSKYRRKHPYTLQVGNPTLMIQDKNLKFGMVTTESFITTVPVRIYNYFNIPVNFRWEELCSDIPFDIIPISGTIPKQTCFICDVMYVCKPTKTKVHEVDFVSQSKTLKVVPIELNIITRKLSIKFLQPAVMFRDIALNLKTTEKVKLENSSREIVFFHVVEPLIPGLIIEPVCGTIRPKTIIPFEITVKIPCVLEFAFDIIVKINNKENIILPISGNVVEPKILINSKNVYMSRVPCFMITYVPILFQNLNTVKCEVEIMQTRDENIFDVYIDVGNEKQRVLKFNVEGNQSRTVFIKVYDIFRREYEMYVPFRINGLLGPPNHNPGSTELQYYVREFQQ